MSDSIIPFHRIASGRLLDALAGASRILSGKLHFEAPAGRGWFAELDLSAELRQPSPGATILVELTGEGGQRWSGTAVVKRCRERNPMTRTVRIEGQGPLRAEQPVPLVVRVSLPAGADNRQRESPLGLLSIEQTARLTNLGMAADFLGKAMDFALAAMVPAGSPDGRDVWLGPLTLEAKLQRLRRFVEHSGANLPEPVGAAPDQGGVASEDSHRMPGIVTELAEFQEFCDDVRCWFEQLPGDGNRVEFLPEAAAVESQARRAHALGLELMSIARRFLR